MSLSAEDRATLRRVLAATLPSLLAIACGTSGSGFDAGADAGDEPIVGCGGCLCDASASTTYATTYTVCPADGGSLDAGADASSDAGKAGEAGTCYPSCGYACAATTPNDTTSACISEDDGGAERTAQCRSDSLACTGRRTDGLTDPPAPSTLAETLAKLAWLEAASVHSFRRLTRELRAHGAPRELVDLARTAARDEIRHARTMRSLAARHGMAVAPVRAAASDAVRDLETVARENAIEGCVVETFGALLAAWQAERAEDESIRDAMRAIAPDELRHASLAWAIAAWVEPRLEPSARARVRASRERAATECAENAAMGDPAIARTLGLPSDEAARSLAKRISA